MRVRRIYPTTHFQRAYRRLPPALQVLARQREQVFLANPFDPRLKTHKLHGSLEGYWSYSVDYRYRVLFRFIDDETVLYLDIGTHDIYR